MSNLSQFAFSPLGTSFRGCICPGPSSLPTTSSCACANYTIQTTACDSHSNLGCLIRLCNTARRILYCNNVGHCSLCDVYVIYTFQNSCCPCSGDLQKHIKYFFLCTSAKDTSSMTPTTWIFMNYIFGIFIKICIT